MIKNGNNKIKNDPLYYNNVQEDQRKERFKELINNNHNQNTNMNMGYQPKIQPQ